MGNFINIGNGIEDPYLKMSNGATAVFITIIGLSGSRLAKTESEKKMIVWLNQHDQSCCGLGNVGFDLTEMPWRQGEFAQLKDFLHRAIEGAAQENGWATLGYDPNKELLLPRLDTMKQMLDLLQETDVAFESVEWENDQDCPEGDWDRYPLHEKYEMSRSDLHRFPECDKHGMLLSIFGCHACNDEE